MRGREDAERFLASDDRDELRDRVASLDESDHYLDAVGPPNVLLINRGEGRFGVASESRQLAVWRNTLQATWADFDTDGDPDLYVANDFAPDNLFRNDGIEGFVDVTREVAGDAMMGFGMGASWGDYDNDGRQDLYVSNMYSKAGMRIAAQVDGVDRQLLRSTEGNILFRNSGTSFDQVSGLQAPALTVAKAGWSWGGQFIDVDNDADLDLYVSSGFFTAPPPVASDVDL